MDDSFVLSVLRKFGAMCLKFQTRYAEMQLTCASK